MAARNSRRMRDLLAALCLIALLGGASAPDVMGATVVLQDVETGSYPEVSIDVALSADLVPEAGAPGFTVLENGIEVEGVRAELAAQDRAPLDVVLLIDVSGSMRGGPLAGAKDAARRFVSAMRPTDRIALVVFSSEARTVSGFGSDVAALERAIDSLEASGETALHDGLIQASRMFEDVARDRAIVVLSDGGDTTSINTLDTAADAVVEAGAPVYAVALESPEYDPSTLEQLASRSGGRFIGTPDAAVLAEIFEDIARELRELYTLTFASARPTTKSLEIEVLVVHGDSTGRLTTVVENPLYVDAPQSEPPVARDTVLLDTVGLLLTGVLVFAAVGLGVYGVGSLLTPGPDVLDQLRYYDQYREGLSDDAVAEAAARGSRAKVLDAVAGIAEARGFSAMVRDSLERAGLPLRPNEYIYFHVLGTLAVGSLVQLLFGMFVVSALAVVVAVTVPIVLLSMTIERRTRRFEEQLPDVLSLIAGSLRAGWGIQQSLDLAVEEIAEPSASEFRRVQAETRFGLPLEQALARMADRLGSEDFRWTVTAIAIQREVGGNLAEVLDIVADTIRTRAELRRHVSALTAEGRFSAVVLAIMPFFVIVLLAIIRPDHIALVFTSPVAMTVFALGLLLLIIGVVWVLRLTKVEV